MAPRGRPHDLLRLALLSGLRPARRGRQPPQAGQAALRPRHQGRQPVHDGAGPRRASRPPAGGEPHGLRQGDQRALRRRGPRRQRDDRRDHPQPRRLARHRGARHHQGQGRAHLRADPRRLRRAARARRVDAPQGRLPRVLPRREGLRGQVPADPRQGRGPARLPVPPDPRQRRALLRARPLRRRARRPRDPPLREPRPDQDLRPREDPLRRAGRLQARHPRAPSRHDRRGPLQGRRRHGQPRQLHRHALLQRPRDGEVREGDDAVRRHRDAPGPQHGDRPRRHLVLPPLPQDADHHRPRHHRGLLHLRGGQRPQARPQRRRPPRPAEDALQALREPDARRGHDRGRAHGHRRRRRGGPALHVPLLPRHGPRGRPGARAQLRPSPALRRRHLRHPLPARPGRQRLRRLAAAAPGPDAARHRRPAALRRHGGGRQRPHLRAHPRGAQGGTDRLPVHHGRLQARLLRDLRRQPDDRPHGRAPLRRRHRPRPRLRRDASRPPGSRGCCRPSATA